MSLKYVLLTLLEREPRTGYDLVRTFESAVGYFWNASHQQVYRELAGLSESGLLRYKQIKQDDKPDKKIYSLSSTGKSALQDWLENPLKPGKTKDLLLVKLLNANSDNLELMQRELTGNMTRSKELQAIYHSIEKQYYSPVQLKQLPDSEIMTYAALRKGILSIDAHLVWLNEVERLIADTFERR